MTDEPYLYLAPGAGDPKLILVCDHASNALPPEMDGLGLAPSVLASHIAYDIGAGEVAKALASRFGAPAILARWSRLLVDLNRGEDDPTLAMKISDGAIVPGNRFADAAEIAARIARFHAPYHARIAEEIAEARRKAIVPALVSIHSFTPVWKGRARPWELGVLWDRDGRLAKPLIDRLQRAGFAVGDNEPYSGQLEGDCMHRHGTMNGLPHALIEIRQDLISNEIAARAMAERLAPVVAAALADLGAPEIRYSRPLAVRKEPAMHEKTRLEVEAAAFRRLVAHLRARTDVQNIDLMNLAGFCRNCLGDWYREAAAERGVALEKDAAREIVYGMAPAEWKRKYQTEASPEQKAKFSAAQKTHS